MATTTNYGWTTPDDTDLVKDGAAAIRTLGSSVDTTTKNLNPSTTLGDIEYRSSTANTNTRLGIGSSGQVLAVSGGVPAWTTPASGIPANDFANVASLESTTSTSYTDLTTAGPAVTVTTGTKALVIITAIMRNNVNGARTSMTFAVSGATTIAAADENAYIVEQSPDSIWHRASAATALTLTAGSNTFTAKYKTSSGTSNFQDRQIFVINLA
jgi:hypothetical protein